MTAASAQRLQKQASPAPRSQPAQEEENMHNSQIALFEESDARCPHSIDTIAWKHFARKDVHLKWFARETLTEYENEVLLFGTDECSFGILDPPRICVDANCPRAEAFEYPAVDPDNWGPDEIQSYYDGTSAVEKRTAHYHPWRPVIIGMHEREGEQTVRIWINPAPDETWHVTREHMSAITSAVEGTVTSIPTTEIRPTLDRLYSAWPTMRWMEIGEGRPQATNYFLAAVREGVGPLACAGMDRSWPTVVMTRICEWETLLALMPKSQRKKALEAQAAAAENAKLTAAERMLKKREETLTKRENRAERQRKKEAFHTEHFGVTPETLDDIRLENLRSRDERFERQVEATLNHFGLTSEGLNEIWHRQYEERRAELRAEQAQAQAHFGLGA
jgi:hypothetical protein